MQEYQKQRENYSDRTVYVTQPAQESNGVGMAGFVLALISFFLGWLLWLLGLVLSFVGMFREPRGFAIAGLVISLLGIFLVLMLLIFFGATALFSVPFFAH